MKVGSEQFARFSTSFLDLLLVVCNSFGAEILFDTYLQISAAHTIN